MSNTDGFIEEVSEEVRKDKLFALYKKYGWIAVLVIFGLVGGAGFLEYQKSASANAAAARGDALIAALEQDDATLRALELNNISNSGGTEVPIDLKTEDIDGESCVTFHPNTIVYAVPKASGLGKTISGSKIGVVWHTTYAGSTLETMSASFGIAISTKLSKVKSVWHVDATFEDKSGTATFTDAENKALTAQW